MDYPLKYWLPYKLNFDQDEILAEWLFVGDKKFTKPFFESTILNCKNFPENQQKFKSKSTLNALPEFSRNVDSIAPTAFIFHISRCGSTLVSQLLSVDNENIVVAEAPFFDEILNKLKFSEYDFSQEEIISLLKASLKYYSQKRNETEQNFYLKLDSWHIMFYETIRKAFPQTPFIFLYREPIEVINSHRKQPGLQAIPGLLNPDIFGIKLDENLIINQELYLIKVLECYFEKLNFIAQNDQNSLFLNYSERTFPIIERIEHFLKIEIKPNIKTEMLERSKFHSKKTNQIFDEKLIENSSNPNILFLNELFEKLIKTI